MPNSLTVGNAADQAQIDAINAAYAMQDACNMVAIVGEWHKHLLALNADLGTDAICRHPSTMLMVDKLASLSRCAVTDIEQAYAVRRDLLAHGFAEWSY